VLFLCHGRASCSTSGCRKVSQLIACRTDLVAQGLQRRISTLYLLDAQCIAAFGLHLRIIQDCTYHSAAQEGQSRQFWRYELLSLSVISKVLERVTSATTEAPQMQWYATQCLVSILQMSLDGVRSGKSILRHCHCIYWGDEVALVFLTCERRLTRSTTAYNFVVCVSPTTSVVQH